MSDIRPASLSVIAAESKAAQAAAPAPAAVSEPSAIRNFLGARGSGRLADMTFGGVMLLAALSLFVIIVLIVGVLIAQARMSIHAFGFHFFTRSAWDPVNGDFGALPFIFGTIVSSLLALLIAVPLALAVAIFVLDICPAPLRSPIAFLTELLAAIPSVVYGLWGIFILIFPVICALSRDVMRAVPNSQREAALALGATRWETIRMGVLRNARIGIVGAVILGLGRALGETMAVTMVIGNHPDISKNLFNPAYTLSSVIANEFSEATGDLYISALVEIGLALFVVTIVVNAIARLLVWAVTRGYTARAA